MKYRDVDRDGVKDDNEPLLSGWTIFIDADNDGRFDEDGPEDLNKDGYISIMRVKDPKGPYMVHPEDPRLLRRADAAKGEAGGYAIYWEGVSELLDANGQRVGRGYLEMTGYVQALRL